MGWFSTGRGYSPGPRVTRIDLPKESNKSFKIKTAAAIVLAAVGIFALVWAVNGLLTKEPGWTEIEAGGTDEPTCASDFVLYFNAGADGSSPTDQIKALTALYTDVSIHAEKLFSASVTDDEIHGVGQLNVHVNQPVVLDREAYDALALLQKYKSREIFLAPVYEQYTTLFFCVTDEEAESLDPAVNEEQREIIAEMVSFTSDPNHIEIILEEGNRATLRVSDEYLAYARENGIEIFVDLYWMKNAFAADYIAERLSAEGFTDGYLSCGEGFTRSLGGKDISLNSTVYDRVEKNIYKAASVQFGAVKSVVIFHSFPSSKTNDKYYYQYSNGRMVTPYISAKDGLCKAPVSNLTLCSDKKSCAETMLSAKSAYVSREFDAQKLQKKLADQYGFVYSTDNTVYISSSKIKIVDLLNDGVVSYHSQLIRQETESQS